MLHPTTRAALRDFAKTAASSPEPARTVSELANLIAESEDAAERADKAAAAAKPATPAKTARRRG